MNMETRWRDEKAGVVVPLCCNGSLLQVDSRAESFVVFRNADTDAVSILYRRSDGNYGLIEPD